MSGPPLGDMILPMIADGDKTGDHAEQEGDRGARGRFLPGNSRAYKRGVSNPKHGFPAGQPRITERIRRLLLADGGRLADAVAKRVLKEAIEKGEFRFCEFIVERMEGKLPDSVISFTGDDMVKVVRGIDLDAVLGRKVGDDGDGER